MSLHSVDHTDSEITERAYKGYHIDNAGEVTEFYDHRNDQPGSSSVVTSHRSHQPLLRSNGNTPSVAVSQPQTIQIVEKRDAGCCEGCVSVLAAIGTLPLATGLALFLSWLGTAMFIGGGWSALDKTTDLFLKYGPDRGNPATDPAPQYIYTGAGGTLESSYILRDDNVLGNRVPEVFQAIKYSFYAIIPFMLIFSIILVFDNRMSSRAIRSKKHSLKTGSSGICCTGGLIMCTYILILAWIFFLAFTTLGVYYYRISMLRCTDLNYREYPDGVFKSICIDLVQIGLIMFQDTNDDGFGKICGPGDNTRGFGKLDEYCENYYPGYQFILIAFSGCLLNVIAMINFLMILSVNYNNLTRRHLRPNRRQRNEAVAATTTAASSRGYTPAPTFTTAEYPAPPPYKVEPIRANEMRDRRSSRDLDYPDTDFRNRRSSMGIELDYLIDGESTIGPRREMDSHVGLDYYYRR